jgi:hypothetical protein
LPVAFFETFFAEKIIQAVSIKSEDLQSYKKPTQVGFKAGVVASLPLTNNFSLRPSLNFLQKKSKIKFETEARTNSIKGDLNYLELPVNLVYSGSMKGMSVYFAAGPSFHRYLLLTILQSKPENVLSR